MKIFKFLVLSVLLSTLFTGCASTTPSEAIIETKSDKGAFFIYRPHNTIWKRKRFNIYINNKFEEMFMNAKYYTFDKPDGEYLIEIKEDIEVKPEIYKLKVKLSKNKIKYVRFGADDLEGHLKLKTVRKSIAIGEDDLYKKGY